MSDFGPAYSRDALVAASGHGFVFRADVRFQDIDAAGIVFFARIFDYFHDAYVAFLAESGHPLHTAISTNAWGAPLKHVEADYLRPLRFGDPLQVALVRADLDGSNLFVGFRIHGADGAVAAVGRTHHVFVDPVAWKRTAPPEALRIAFNRLGRSEGA
jgi:YbgC/YbaW family acyl-CoA thioester hydrolase